MSCSDPYCDGDADHDGPHVPGRCSDPYCDGSAGHDGQHFQWIPV